MNPLPVVLSICILFACFGVVSSSAGRPERSSSVPPRKNPAPGDDHNTRIIATILKEIKSSQAKHTIEHRPFVTLTFAQSLDGRIALKYGAKTSSNLPLSGDESLLLTHGLRSVHDAILVGGRTLYIDNPRLSNRFWGNDQPRPVVLDSSLHHVRKLGHSRKARNPIVCCSYEAALLYQNEQDLSIEIMPCQCDIGGRLILRDVLERLVERFGIRSVMIEGGASVHSSFLSERLVDCLCVTIAPKLLGNDHGLACFSSIQQLGTDTQQQYINLSSESGMSRFIPLGSDCVYLCQWPSD
jgi:3,4-dihydroxy 2-butanone 4-phosphate synthase/GTP cyclohydrolase II